MAKQSRYRGLKPNPAALGVTPLTAGEVSRPVRVRASTDVHNWLRGFTAAQLGELLTQVYQQQTPVIDFHITELPTYSDAPYTHCDGYGLRLDSHPELRDIMDYLDSGGTVKITAGGEYFVIVPGYDIEQEYPVTEAQLQQLVDMGWLQHRVT